MTTALTIYSDEFRRRLSWSFQWAGMLSACAFRLSVFPAMVRFGEAIRNADIQMRAFVAAYEARNAGKAGGRGRKKEG